MMRKNKPVIKPTLAQRIAARERLDLKTTKEFLVEMTFFNERSDGVLLPENLVFNIMNHLGICHD